MHKETISQDFNGKVSELPRLISSWNLMSTSSNDDFHELSKKILRNLYEGQSELKIQRIIESELCLTYGLFTTDFDVEKLLKQVTHFFLDGSPANTPCKFK